MILLALLEGGLVQERLEGLHSLFSGHGAVGAGRGLTMGQRLPCREGERDPVSPRAEGSEQLSHRVTSFTGRLVLVGSESLVESLTLRSARAQRA